MENLNNDNNNNNNNNNNDNYFNNNNNNRKMIIPSLLGEQQPILKGNWDIIRGKKVEGYLLGRNYYFEFLPLGFFSRLFVRNFHLPNIEVITYWRNGMLLKKNFSKGLLRYNPSRYILSLEVMNEKSEKDSEEYFELTSFLRLLIETIETTIEGWYETKVDIKIPCTHCLLEGDYSPHIFTLEECISSIQDSIGYVYCKNVRRVRIDLIAPDLSFMDMKKFIIQYNGNISIIESIGEGAFGAVYLGLLNNITKVAIKELVIKTDHLQSKELINQRMITKFTEFQREVWIMSCLNHINICSLKGITNNPMAMILEYIPLGDLYHLINYNNPDIDFPSNNNINNNNNLNINNNSDNLNNNSNGNNDNNDNNNINFK